MDMFDFYSDMFEHLEDSSENEESLDLNKGDMYKYHGNIYKYIGIDVVFGFDEDVLVFDNNGVKQMFTKNFFNENFSKINPKDFLRTV